MLQRRAILRTVCILLPVAACAGSTNGSGLEGTGGMAGTSSDAGVDSSDAAVDSGPACSGDWELFSTHNMETAGAGDDAIFFRSSESLHRLPLDGSGHQVVGMLDKRYWVSAVSTSYVYLNGNHALERISKSGGSIEVIDDSWYVNSQPAIGGGIVYYLHLTEYDGVHQLRWIPEDGGQYQLVLGDYGSTSIHLVADDTGAYFTSALGLRAFHPDSGQRELLAPIPGPAVVSLAVGPSAVFISTDDVGSATEPTLLRVSKDGASSSVLIEQSGGVITDGVAFDSLRVQGDYVYFVQDFVNQDPDGFLTRVLRVPVQGGEPELVGEMDRKPGYDWIRLYSNGEHLYLLRRDGVRRRCLPP